MRGVIPVIDLQGFPGESEKLREASEEWGCFRVVNHDIPPTLMSEMKKIVKSLFELPTKIKRRNTSGIDGSGYSAGTQDDPLREALGLYDMASSGAVDAFCTQLHSSPHQRETIKMYTEAVHELAMDMARKLAGSLGLVAGDFFKGWPCQFMLNRYNFTSKTVGSSGLQMHTDSGLLTILQDDENAGGLEVMDMSGAFVAVEPLPGTFFVNLGDVATAWSNGRFCNAKHRVICKEAGIRVSIAWFVLGPKEEKVEAPPELVDAEHPRLYVPFAYTDYRSLRLSTRMLAGQTLALVRADS